jgi:hypothetical protein
VHHALPPRLGAACGTLFAALLFAGDRTGTQPVAVAGLVCFIPFLAYLASILRTAEGPNGWVAPTAFAAGLCGITIKLVSAIPERALRHVNDATPLARLARDLGDGAFVIAFWPLAICCATTAAIILNTKVLPRWLGWFSAVTAAALAVNGGFFDASFGPAFLLFLLWVLATSIALLRTAPAPAPVPARTDPATTAAAA